jgi:hypothetical protein
MTAMKGAALGAVLSIARGVRWRQRTVRDYVHHSSRERRSAWGGCLEFSTNKVPEEFTEEDAPESGPYTIWRFTIKIQFKRYETETYRFQQ